MCSLIILLHGNIILSSFTWICETNEIRRFNAFTCNYHFLHYFERPWHDFSVCHIYVEEQIYSVVCTLKNCNDSKGDK